MYARGHSLTTYGRVPFGCVTRGGFLRFGSPATTSELLVAASSAHHHHRHHHRNDERIPSSVEWPKAINYSHAHLRYCENMKIRNFYIGEERRGRLLYTQDTPAE